MSEEIDYTLIRRIGFVGLLTLLFIALKSIGVITWSWLWILSPLWISFLLGVLIPIIIVGIIILIKK